LKSFIKPYTPQGALPVPSATYSMNDNVGGVFGGGLDVLVTNNVSLGIDVTYLYLRTTQNADAKHTKNGVVVDEETSNGSVKLDSVRLLGGLKIRFGGN